MVTAQKKVKTRSKPVSTTETTSKESGQIRSFSVLLSGSWQIFKRSFVNYLLLLLVAVGLVGTIIIITFSFTFFPNFNSMTTNLFSTPVGLILIIFLIFLYYVVALFIPIFFELAIKHIIITTGEGEPTDFRLSLKYSYRNLGSFFSVSLVSGILSIMGYYLLIIPGVIISIILSQVANVFVLENRNGLSLGTLDKSCEITKGYRWIVLGRYILLYVFLLSPLLISALLTLVSPVMTIIFFVVFVCTIISFSPITTAFNYLIYKDLVKIQSN
ncbi:MAG: hypothetical protein WCP14_00845 [bacterium]